MIFFSIFLILLVLTLIELISGKCLEKSFKIMFILITLLTLFRFGVGTDYFLYMYWYNNIPKIIDPLFFTNLNQIHGEIGFKILMGVCKTISMKYTTFMFIVSGITMILFYSYINKQSRMKVTSMFIFYSNLYYFTYVNGGIRQAFTLGFFLAILLPILKKKQYVRYVILTLIASSIHTSILVVLILPFISFDFDLKRITLAVFGTALVGILGIQVFGKVLPYSIYKSIAIYGENGGNILPILSRIVFLIIVIILILQVKQRISTDEKKIFNYYIVGVLVYFAIFKMELVASRTTLYFKAFEIILIPNFISLICSKTNKLINSRTNKLIITYSICIIISFMWYKEITSQLLLGQYYNNTSVTEYKYVSIFNKDEILMYRPPKTNGGIYVLNWGQ